MNILQAQYLPADKLIPFKNHPFQVKDDEEMDWLVQSISTQGVLTPLTVRSLDNGTYEVISGHRRLHACKKAGIKTVPAFIYELDQDAAAIALADSNLHREHILPSERAYACRMKLEALSHQGKRQEHPSAHLGQKSLWSVEQVADDMGSSRSQVQRYIRLTYLIPEFLQLVDQGKISLTPAAELSYLKETEQKELLDAMKYEDCSPSLFQAVKLKKMSQALALNTEIIHEIMTQPKANQQEKIIFRMDELQKFFPGSYDPNRIREAILNLLSAQQKRRQQELSR